MADLQFHSNHCYIAESTRATAEENRPQQDRESEEGASGEFGHGEHFTGMSLVCVYVCVCVCGGGADSKVNEQNVSSDASVKKEEMKLWRKWIELFTACPVPKKLKTDKKIQKQTPFSNLNSSFVELLTCVVFFFFVH